MNNARSRTPIYDHPDFEHVGFVPRRAVEKRGAGVISKASSRQKAPDDIPLFKHKDGSHLAVSNYSGADGNSFRAYHFPNDGTPALSFGASDGIDMDEPRLVRGDVESWGDHREDFDDEDSPMYTGFGLSEENLNRSGVKNMRRVGEVIKAHFPDHIFTGERVTGRQPGREVFLDTKRFTAEEVERYYNEAYDG